MWCSKCLCLWRCDEKQFHPRGDPSLLFAFDNTLHLGKCRIRRIKGFSKSIGVKRTDPKVKPISKLYPRFVLNEFCGLYFYYIIVVSILSSLRLEKQSKQIFRKVKAILLAGKLSENSYSAMMQIMTLKTATWETFQKRFRDFLLIREFIK